MAGAIVVINAGSSSIKFALFDTAAGACRDSMPVPQLRGQIAGLGSAPRLSARSADGRILVDDARTGIDHDAALKEIVNLIDQQLAGRLLLAAGHRVVHGGSTRAESVIVDDARLQELEALVPLAPLHQPHNLAAIRMLMKDRPELPQVACFDTAFHRSNPEVAQMFGLPLAFHADGIRRYGFHGLSYEHVVSALHQLDPKAGDGRVVVLHLGAGCSMCAIQGGHSVATTMGFTALDGLMMGTRCGDLDPGVLLFLMQVRAMRAEEIERLLYAESGLLGVSGISSDMRVLLASDEPTAKLAIDLFCYRVRRELGSLVAALGGIDAIVFTAGIGENSPAIRARVLADAAWCGVRCDDEANRRSRPRIDAAGSLVRAWVIPTDEESMIVRHTQHVLALY